MNKQIEKWKARENSMGVLLQQECGSRYSVYKELYKINKEMNSLIINTGKLTAGSSWNDKNPKPNPTLQIYPAH